MLHKRKGKREIARWERKWEVPGNRLSACPGAATELAAHATQNMVQNASETSCKSQNSETARREQGKPFRIRYRRGFSAEDANSTGHNLQVGKWDSTKWKGFCNGKKAVAGVKRQPTGPELFPEHTADRINTPDMWGPSKLNTNTSPRLSSTTILKKEETQKANKYVGKCAKSSHWGNSN